MTEHADLESRKKSFLVNTPRKARALPICKKVMDVDILEKFMRAHKPVGDVYDSSVVAYLRQRNIPVPDPRSNYNPEELFGEQFYSYWAPVQCQWDERALRIATQQLKESYSMIGNDLELSSLESVVADIKHSIKRTKSSGLPHLSKKVDVIDKDVRLAKAISTGRVAPPPAVAYYRTQPKKVRLVWGYPSSMTLLEGRIMQSIEEKLVCTEVPYAYSYTTNGIAGRLNPLSYGEVQYCLDWSKFDATVPKRAIHQCFRIVRDWFGNQFSDLFDIVERYFVTCPLLMPDGKVYKGRTRGIPSGSWFTQLIGSMVNQLLVTYISIVTQEEVKDGLYMGDDSVLEMTSVPTVHEWASVAKMFGMTLNPDKQVVTHGHPHFLRHIWLGSVPVRPEEETLQRLATSERYKKFADKEEYFAWTIDKAKSLLVDNPRAYPLLLDYISWRHRLGKVSIARALTTGNMMGGSRIRRGWAESDTTLPAYKSRDGLKRGIGEQILCH